MNFKWVWNLLLQTEFNFSIYLICYVYYVGYLFSANTANDLMLNQLFSYGRAKRVHVRTAYVTFLIYPKLYMC